jgi:hypothetical protein
MSSAFRLDEDRKILPNHVMTALQRTRFSNKISTPTGRLNEEPLPPRRADRHPVTTTGKHTS